MIKEAARVQVTRGSPQWVPVLRTCVVDQHVQGLVLLF